VANRNLERALGPLVADTALHRPEELTGAGAARLARRAADDPALANGPVTIKVLRTAIKRSHASVSVGTLSACLTPTGGPVAARTRPTTGSASPAAPTWSSPPTTGPASS
jgi:hypothetical protein